MSDPISYMPWLKENTNTLNYEKINNNNSN